jgi:aminoglycoside 3-N-acetyltransferase I
MRPEIKKLSSQDIATFTALLGLFEDVFELQPLPLPHQDYLRQLLADQNFWVYVALQNHKVLGGLTAYRLAQHHSSSPLVYIHDLAVAKDRQRQGIGKELVSALLHHCRVIGAEGMFVQAEEEDAHAIDFYRATGSPGERIYHFYYPLNTP